MTLRDSLLKRIADYRESHAMSERQFSLLASGHTNAVSRLRAGQATLRTIEAIERVLAEAEPPPPAPAPQPMEQAA